MYTKMPNYIDKNNTSTCSLFFDQKNIRALQKGGSTCKAIFSSMLNELFCLL
jgi:hypothetical protein